jgi:transposase
MMGQLPAQQNTFFYEFCLEKHIPGDHLLRQIDQFLDFDQTRVHLDPFYSHTGRPSIDPELMIRMLLIGYCYGIRSERRLCEEIRYNLAYRWFCRLGLEDEAPDHSTFSKNPTFDYLSAGGWGQCKVICEGDNECIAAYAEPVNPISLRSDAVNSTAGVFHIFYRSDALTKEWS